MNMRKFQNFISAAYALSQLAVIARCLFNFGKSTRRAIKSDLANCSKALKCL